MRYKAERAHRRAKISRQQGLRKKENAALAELEALKAVRTGTSHLTDGHRILHHVPQQQLCRLAAPQDRSARAGALAGMAWHGMG